MQTSESITTLMPALLAAQKQIRTAIKSAENPYFGSHYADLTTVLDAIKGPLNNHGIVFMQGIDCWPNDEHGEGGPYVETRLVHAESGEWVRSQTPIICAKENDPQAFGSGSTYAKRYAAQAIVALPTEDDDAEKAQGHQEEPRIAKKPNIDLKLLRSEKGIEYLRQFATSADAIRALDTTKNLTPTARKAIEVIFAGFQAEGNETNDSPSDETTQS